jgi:hypothetical protein
MNCYVAKLFDNYSIKILEDAESTKFVKVSKPAVIETDLILFISTPVRRQLQSHYTAQL